MFQLGDWAYRATLQHSQVEVTCPDCFGRRALVVILGDDSRVTIDCSTCAAGYEPPRGFIRNDATSADAEYVQITKIEMETNNGVPVTLYSGVGFYRIAEDDLYTDVDKAQARAETLALERQQEQSERAKRKEKDTRTWAWHVTYHRRCVKQAEKDLAYHTSKLAVALLKRKGE
jgi:hypothetical protein